MSYASMEIILTRVRSYRRWVWVGRTGLLAQRSRDRYAPAPENFEREAFEQS